MLHGVPDAVTPTADAMCLLFLRAVAGNADAWRALAEIREEEERAARDRAQRLQEYLDFAGSDQRG